MKYRMELKSKHPENYANGLGMGLVVNERKNSFRCEYWCDKEEYCSLSKNLTKGRNTGRKINFA